MVMGVMFANLAIVNGGPTLQLFCLADAEAPKIMPRTSLKKDVQHT